MTDEVEIPGFRLTALESEITLCDCRCSLPWDDSGLELLQIDERIPRYRITTGFEYRRDEVLNQWVDTQSKLQRHGVVEGAIILISPVAIPSVYIEGAPIAMELKLTDQLDRSFPLSVTLIIDLMMKRSPEIRRPEGVSSLYSDPSTAMRKRYPASSKAVITPPPNNASEPKGK